MPTRRAPAIWPVGDVRGEESSVFPRILLFSPSNIFIIIPGRLSRRYGGCIGSCHRDAHGGRGRHTDRIAGSELRYGIHDGESLIWAGDHKAPVSLGERERDGDWGRSRCRYNREACLSSKCPRGSPSPSVAATAATAPTPGALVNAKTREMMDGC